MVNFSLFIVLFSSVVIAAKPSQVIYSVPNEVIDVKIQKIQMEMKTRARPAWDRPRTDLGSAWDGPGTGLIGKGTLTRGHVKIFISILS